MRTTQCGVCVRYRGDLTCDAFEDGIPEMILTGQADHSNPYEGDGGKLFKPFPGVLQKSEEVVHDHTLAIAERDERAYNKVRAVLKEKGYKDSDFDDKDGALYGYSVNELIDLAREKD